MKACLIQADGPARPGQLAVIGDALAVVGAELLDIQQGADEAGGGLMARVAFPPDVSLDAWSRDVVDNSRLALRLQAIDPGELTCPPRNAADDTRLLLTLMAPRLPVELLGDIERLASRFALRIDSIQRLSEPLRPMAEAPSSGACIECLLSGETVEVEALRRDALALGSERGVDIAVQEGSPWRRRRRLVCFDMDSTLISTEVIDELARRHGVGDEVAEITERAMRGELDFKASFKARMRRLEGLDEAVLADIALSLPLMDGVERLMLNLKQLGYRTAIISGGFTYFAHHLQTRLGVDEIHANHLVIDNGKVTGEVQAPIIDAQRKADLLEQIARREGLALEQTIAVGDGANDLKMLAAAGLGIAFRAKPMVREQARQSIATLGIDAVLYLMGYRHSDLVAHLPDTAGIDKTVPD